MISQSARIVGTRLILGTAADLAERNLAKRREISQLLDNAVRALVQHSESDLSREVMLALVDASRALNALSEVC